MVAVAVPEMIPVVASMVKPEGSSWESTNPMGVFVHPVGLGEL